MRKAELRKELQRRLAEESELAEKSEEVWKRLMALPAVLESSSVAAYCETEHEVRTRCYFERLWNAGKSVSLPACEHSRLVFYTLKSLDELTPGRYGILEPSEAVQSDSSRRTAPEAIDLILIPGLGFSPGGARLGRGMGYYDRFLPLLRSGARRIGLAFECQLVSALPVEGHDQKLDALVTERSVYTCVCAD